MILKYKSFYIIIAILAIAVAVIYFFNGASGNPYAPMVQEGIFVFNEADEYGYIY